MRVLCITMLVFLFASCELFHEQDSREKIYKAKVQWSREFITSSGTDSYPLVDGNYCYVPVNIDSGYGTILTKVNLDTGKVIWETDKIEDTLNIGAFKIGDYIYLSRHHTLYEYLYVYNDSNGKLAATIKLDYKLSERTMVISGFYLCWSDKGLMRFDPGDIDFSIDPEEIQSITPEIIGGETITGDEAQHPFIQKILFEDGIFYFLLREDSNITRIYDEKVLVAFDMEANEVIWKITLPPGFLGRYPYLVLNGEKLHIIEESNLCVNKNNGSIIYYNLNETYVSESKYGIVLHDNRLYYSTTSIPYDHKNSKIVALNAETGKLAWQTSEPPKGSTGNLHLYGNKVYLLTRDGLSVYNIDKHRNNFIGIDKSFSSSNDFLFLYGDLLIFIDRYAGNSCIKLIAIKCE